VTLNLAQNGQDATHQEPVSVLRSVSPGDTVSFFFSPPLSSIASGNASSYLLVNSDATAWATDLGTVVSEDGFAPVGLFVPVPEPAQFKVVIWLGSIGFTCLAPSVRVVSLLGMVRLHLV
jgi:hypothetical protein